jgi:phage recombination protein Bet
MGQEVAAKATAGVAAPMTRAELIKTLGNSLYVGAKPESIGMVLDYCAAAGLDPMMKPVHIVPMNVKKPGTNTYEWRDVIMPGIDLYRLKASRSNVYLGKSEPEFGPDVEMTLDGVKITVPSWCKVTVQRRIGDHVANFTATERWTENYATAGKDTAKPNTMWAKRPYGQLAKCAEAQALRMAFPDLVGGEQTAEEMAGKVIEGSVIPEVTQAAPKPALEQRRSAALDTFAGTRREPEKVNRDPAERQREERQADPSDFPGDAAKAPQADLAEVSDAIGLPAMPDEAASDLASGKWARAWRWIQEALPGELPEVQQALVEEHNGLLRTVAAYSARYRQAVVELEKKHGLAINLG